jgi:hypothetical protein
MKSKHSRRTVPMSLSQYAFACGAGTGVRRSRSPKVSLNSSSIPQLLERPASGRMGSLGLLQPGPCIVPGSCGGDQPGGSGNGSPQPSPVDVCSQVDCGSTPTRKPPTCSPMNHDPRCAPRKPPRGTTNCTPGAAGCFNVPAKPAACQGVTPADFDYTTPQIYMGPNGNPIIQSAQQHITEGHIFPGEPGNTMYGTFPPTDPSTLFQQVQGYNATTFTFGQASQQGNGNISFTYDFPVTMNPFNGLPAVIGYFYDALGLVPLNTNQLVLAGNCTLVRTSFPTSNDD